MDSPRPPALQDHTARQPSGGGRAQPGPGLPLHHSLDFKFALLFLLLLVLLLAGGYAAAKHLVFDDLVDESLRQNHEAALRKAAYVEQLAQRAQTLAAGVAAVAARWGEKPESAAPLIPNIIESAGPQIGALGLWPQPVGTPGTAERRSRYWIREAGGELRARLDYNDPQAVPYWTEPWYTPAAHFAPDDRCYWTAAYIEPLSRRGVLSCAVAIRSSGKVHGVVTADLPLKVLGQALNRWPLPSSSWTLLVDAENRLIAASGAGAPLLHGVAMPPHLAELAQQHPGLNPLALKLHERMVVHSAGPTPAADRIAELRAATRDLSERQASAALAQLAAGGFAPGSGIETVQLPSEPMLGGPATATLAPVSGTPWQLVHVVAADEGFAAAALLFRRTLVTVAGMAALALGLAYLILRARVLVPLQRMAASFHEPRTPEELTKRALKISAHNEIGEIAHGLDDRVRQLAEMMDQAIATNAHLVIETNARRDAQNAFARLQERAALTLQAITDGVVTTDERGMVEEMNASAEYLTGFALQDAKGRAFNAVFLAREAGEHGAVLPNLAELAIERGTRLEYPGGVILSGFGGTRRTVAVTVTPVRSRQNRIVGAVAAFSPRTTESVTAAALTAERFTPDPLTGLPTRAACDRRLRLLLDAAKLDRQRHALILLDVDRFQRVLDSGGQPAGDRVLSQLSEALAEKSAGTGELFHLSADEFAILLPSSDADRARAFADALRLALAATRLHWEARYFSVTASFGVAEFGGDAETPGDVLRRAGDACAAAKRGGRNAVKVFDTSMGRADDTADDALWVRRIRAGLDENRFHLTTQPMQPAATHLAEGMPFEAFVALEDEEGFWATPAAFMPAAERHHLLAGVDRWVLSHTIEEMGRRPELLPRIAFVSINLSSGTLSDSSALDLLVRLLQKLPAVPPRKLCFEVHEDAILDHPHAARAFFDTLRSLGCRSAIDHFHGHRSAELEVMRKLPSDFVKIDAQEFKSISADPVEQLMAETTIRLARTLGRRAIICNIDDQRKLEAWRRLGADYCQGFLVGKPSPVLFTPAT